jgi:hypothetical protein
VLTSLMFPSVDLMARCDGPGEKCWSLLHDPNSPLRTAFRSRDLELDFASFDPDRYLIKLFSTREYISSDPPYGNFHFPFLDIFLARRLRCNVSDHLHAHNWKENLIGRRDVSTNATKKQREVWQEKLHQKHRDLHMYETDIWSYHSHPYTPAPSVCSQVTHRFNFQMIREEIGPKRRYRFGPVSLFGPKEGDRVLKRCISKHWSSVLHRHQHSHARPTAIIRIPNPTPERKTKEPRTCMVHLDQVQEARERQWLTRPG